MIPRLFTIERDGPGKLSTMARPRGGDWLEDELAGLKRCGVDALVCTLTRDERVELELEAEARLAQAAGLEFIAAPIEDRCVPEPELVEPALARIAAILAGGGHVVVHCRAGIGRCSMLAAATLVRLGAEPGDTWARIRRARGLEVPDTAEQRAWVDAQRRDD